MRNDKPEPAAVMHEREIREAAKCGMCGKPFGSCGAQFFYRVSLQQFIVDVGALRRQHGLTMMMGNAMLASVMGPNEPMAVAPSPAKTITVCADCSSEIGSVIVACEEQDTPSQESSRG